MLARDLQLLLLGLEFLHNDTLASELQTWTSQIQARTQHQDFQQEECTFRSNFDRKTHVPHFGSLPQIRPDGVVGFMYCQLNGIVDKAQQEEKLSRSIYLSCTHEVDVAALCEAGIVAALCKVGINWSQTP